MSLMEKESVWTPFFIVFCMSFVLTGQAGALRHGIARALCELDEEACFAARPDQRLRLKREASISAASMTTRQMPYVIRFLAFEIPAGLSGDPENDGGCCLLLSPES